jgi:SAM-dependent methyltransferase
MNSFLESFRHRKLDEAFADRTPVALDDPRIGWLNAPSDDFVRYVREHPPTPFDEIPDEPLKFAKKPTFLVAQIHRVWVTIDTIGKNLGTNPSPIVMDLGAFPFAIDSAIRDYLKAPGRVIAVVSDLPRDHWAAEVNARGIELAYTNLDPLVKPNRDNPQRTDRLPADDNSVDLVVFTHVIEHLYHPMMILRECFRVLRPEGRLLISTDNAFMLRGLIRLIQLDDFLHDPVEETAAMTYSSWRGHVRYFSEPDLRAMVKAAGFRIRESSFQEIIYEAFLDDYYHDPIRTLPAWRVDLLTEFPAYRNEIFLVGEKSDLPDAPPPERAIP